MSFTEHNVNGVIFDTAGTLSVGGVRHAFTTRHGGVHKLMEGVRHVAVGLKAALADGGADGRAHRVGVRAVKAHHRDERLP